MVMMRGSDAAADAAGAAESDADVSRVVHPATTGSAAQITPRASSVDILTLNFLVRNVLSGSRPSAATVNRLVRAAADYFTAMPRCQSVSATQQFGWSVAYRHGHL